MYQSDELAIFMKNEIESEELIKKRKEKRIHNLINNITYGNFLKKSKNQLIIIIFISLCICISLFYSAALFDKSNAFLNMGGIITSLFFGWSVSMLFDYNNQSIYSLVKNLFLELSEKPYEIRTTLEEGNKIKIVIEANQYLNDNSLIIKEKSQHITAYLELKAPYTNIVKSVVDLVQKTEDKFSQL